MHYVNWKGMTAILNGLTENHRLPTRWTANELAAWACDVEASLDAGNGAQFEIPAHETNTGVPVIVYLTADCWGYNE